MDQGPQRPGKRCSGALGLGEEGCLLVRRGGLEHQEADFYLIGRTWL